MKECYAAGLLLLVAASLGDAVELKTETIKYTTNGITMHGNLAYPAKLAGRRPGILVVHEWMGLNAYAKRRADQLAGLGYVALAADMYGEGKTAQDAKEAAALSSALKAGDRSELRRRAAAALAALRACEHADPSRLGAIGYCFGGTVVLELARSGASLKGVVSFHGGLDTPNPADARNMQAAVLACHGANDSFVTRQDVEAFQDEMRKAEVDWQMVLYGGAVHSFSNPDSGNDPTKGIAYNAKADRRSWALMEAFFSELFGPLGE